MRISELAPSVPTFSACSAFFEDCWRAAQLVAVFLIAAGTFALPPNSPSAFVPLELVGPSAALPPPTVASGALAAQREPASESFACSPAAYPS